MSTQPKVTPRRPGQRHPRLDSLNNPQPRPPPQPQQPGPDVCPNPECQSNNSEVEDHKVICSDCGAVIREHDMVTDVQYGLSSSGNHVVHGHHVGADQAYVRNGDVFDRNKALTSIEVTNVTGRRYMTQIASALGVNAALLESGMQVYRLASGMNFIQGRRTKSVAAVSLYIACRTQKDNPNVYMLIDFSDVLQLNVFNLGHVYKSLIETIRINPNGHIIQPINPEDLILRFSQRLEFGNETMRVANDAVRIVQRMDRDWMTPGRRPAGICGAALIIAARMNNFRRTVREVVYVVKVQEATIFKRLDEFKVTESSGLTVEEFRTISLERHADPPAFYEQKDGKKKRRKLKHAEFDDDGDDANLSVTGSRPPSMDPSRGDRASSTTPPNSNPQLPTPAHTQQARTDNQNMPPPPLPIDPSLIEVSSQRLSEIAGSRAPQDTAAASPAANAEADVAAFPADTRAISEPPEKRKRGRPPKNASVLSTSQTTADPVLEPEITSAITDPFNLDAAALNATVKSADEQSRHPATQSQALNKPRRPIPSTEEISDSEFASDLEVTNCLLTPTEVSIKTRIWTHENRDYLRAQEAKILRQQLAEANGTARVVKKRQRRRHRVGDLRSYDAGDEGSPVAESPAAAVVKMMDKRAYSRKLNYKMISALYQPSSSATSRRTSIAGAGSPGSGAAMSPDSATLPDVEAPEATTTATTTTGKKAQSTQRAPTEGPNDDAISEAGADYTDDKQKEVDQLLKEMEEEGVYADDVESDRYGADGGGDDAYDAPGAESD